VDVAPSTHVQKLFIPPKHIIIETVKPMPQTPNLVKIYETPSSESKSKTHVLWVSRHAPLKVQIEALEEKLGAIVIYQLFGVVPTADFVVQKAKEVNAKIIVPVLPMSFIAHLVEAGRRSGFVVLFAKMEAIAQTDPETARKMVAEAPDKRTMTTYADGTVKIHEFKGFEKVKAVKIETEPW